MQYEDYGIVFSETFDIAIIFDIITSEEHSIENNITSNPVEAGADITDHIQQQPRRLSVTGLITGAPIYPFINNFDTFDPDVYDPAAPELERRVETAFLTLEKLAAGEVDETGRVQRRPLTIFTVLKNYENMYLQRLSIPKNSGGKDSFQFNAVFQEITIAETESVQGASRLRRFSDVGDAEGTSDQAPDEQKNGKANAEKIKATTLKRGFEKLKETIFAAGR